MGAKIDFGGGRIVELSEESTNNLKKELLEDMPLKGFETSYFAATARKFGEVLPFRIGIHLSLTQLRKEDDYCRMKSFIYSEYEVKQIIKGLQDLIGGNNG